MKTRIVPAALALLALLASPAPRAATLLYLQADGTPMGTLDGSDLAVTALPNLDPGRDAWPGLLVLRGGAGLAETDPARFQQWTAASGPLTLDGPTVLEYWAAMRDFRTGLRGSVHAFLLDCDLGGTGCVAISDGRRSVTDWSAGSGSFTRHAIEFGRVSRTLAADRSLALRIVVADDAEDDMMFAYGVAGYPSRLTDRAKYDTAVDCDFDDWTDGLGVEFTVADQGGPDDWASPARLDVTWFGASSNLVDAVHVLMGMDDTWPKGGAAATLIDTDLDNNANYALVVSYNSSPAPIELYACDDSLTDGCGSAVLRTTYSSSEYCMTPAAGPWGIDTLIEVALPFSDVGAGNGRPIVLTSLVSYAASSLLTSPKDAVLGVGGQDYDAGIFYDLSTGYARFTDGVAPGFRVRRSADPAAVRSAPIDASTFTAPFDTLAGSLSDGRNEFFVVEKTGGVPVSVSAYASRATDSIRLGYDDNDPLSAPVDALTSTVAVTPGTILADGATNATVTVVPRDSFGEPVGAGCEMGVDDVALGPAAMAGPVVDNLDGTYTIRITSTASGEASVSVIVEGMPLVSRPTLRLVSP